jgi:hypothetical protein
MAWYSTHFDESGSNEYSLQLKKWTNFIHIETSF